MGLDEISPGKMVIYFGLNGIEWDLEWDLEYEYNYSLVNKHRP
jgi:hypothetical protein